MMRQALLTAGIVGLVGLLALAIHAQSRIRVQRPRPRAAPEVIWAPGRVEGATPEIELRFQLSGRIQAILVREGDFVRAGQPLGQLDDAQYRHELALAEAQLKLAESQLDRLLNGARPEERAEARALYQAKLAELQRAKITWERIEKLHQARAVSQQEADDQRALVASLTQEVAAAQARVELLEAPARQDELQMAHARIEAARAQVELAKIQLERTQLVAPAPGHILQVNVEPGELTGPDSPRPAIVLVDASRFQVRAFVDELDAPRVRPGMAAIVTADGLGNRKLRGRVTRVSPRMSQKSLWTDRPAERYDTKTREVWIELENPGQLIVGLRVDVAIYPETGSHGAKGDSNRKFQTGTVIP